MKIDEILAYSWLVIGIVAALLVVALVATLVRGAAAGPLFGAALAAHVAWLVLARSCIGGVTL